jgi:hypothetical protein
MAFRPAGVEYKLVATEMALFAAEFHSLRLQAAGTHKAF